MSWMHKYFLSSEQWLDCGAWNVAIFVQWSIRIVGVKCHCGEWDSSAQLWSWATSVMRHTGNSSAPEKVSVASSEQSVPHTGPTDGTDILPLHFFGRSHQMRAAINCVVTLLLFFSYCWPRHLDSQPQQTLAPHKSKSAERFLTLWSHIKLTI